MDGRPLAEGGFERGGVELGDRAGVERAEPLLDLERAGESGRHRHLLVEREADEERHRLRGQELVRLVAVREVQPVGGGDRHGRSLLLEGSPDSSRDSPARSPPGTGGRMSSQIAAKLPTQLRDPGRAGHEPPVQVLAAVAPLADVHAADLADRAHGSLDPRQHDAELRGEVVREVAELGEVLARLEDARPPAGRSGPTRRAGASVRSSTGTRRPAVSIARQSTPPCAVAWLLTLDRRLKRARAHLSVERERLPLLDRGHAQGVRGAFVDLLGGLGHCEADANG